MTMMMTNRRKKMKERKKKRKGRRKTVGNGSDRKRGANGFWKRRLGGKIATVMAKSGYN